MAHGADPNCAGHGYAISGHAYPGTALDYVIASYGRVPERLQACIDVLLAYGATTKYDAAPVLAVLRRQADRLEALLDADPQLARMRFPQLDCGQTGGRSLTLRGATLLHLAAEYGNTAAAGLLLDRGADVNGRAEVDAQGVGGQTALFHAVTQFDDAGLEVTRVLLDCGADVTLRATLPGDYERPEEVVTRTGTGLCAAIRRVEPAANRDALTGTWRPGVAHEQTGAPVGAPRLQRINVGPTISKNQIEDAGRL